MDVTQDYKPPVNEQKPKRGLSDIFLFFFKIFAYPFKFMRNKYQILQEDNNKKKKFQMWRRKENFRYRRGNKINDEF